MSQWVWWLVQPCGTDAAERRHRRRGERPCPACLRAAALARQKRARGRRNRREAA